MDNIDEHRCSQFAFIMSIGGSFYGELIERCWFQNRVLFT